MALGWDGAVVGPPGQQRAALPHPAPAAHAGRREHGAGGPPRYPEQFGILSRGPDRFKKYNDPYGHLAGNDARQRVSRVIREAVRTVDFPARYGGEEFAVIVPQIDGAALAAIAERIRESV